MMVMTRKNRVVVRTFRDTDLPSMKSMIHRTIAACYPAHYCAEAIRFFLHYHSEQSIREDARRGRTLVLTRAGRVLGTGTLLGDEIKRIIVDPTFQRQGLGRLLMQRLEEVAAEAAITAVKLHAALPSKAFYDRLGYDTIAKTSRPVEGGRQLDYFMMQKVLGCRENR